MDLCFFGDNLFGKLSLRSGKENRMLGWASESLEWFGSGGVKDVGLFEKSVFQMP